MTGAHLSDDGLVAFVDGTLSIEERRRWLAHVDGCRACHELLAAVAPALGLGSEADDDPLEQAVAVRGAQVGRFTVLELLGVGATAEVHTAYDPQLDRKVALKLLRGAQSLGGGDQRLLREAQALARLAHPNVVTVFDAGEHGARRFVAMELVEGETLRGWLAARTRTWVEVLHVFLAAGRGLVAAHGVGIVHRDFKPENVLVGVDGRPRVADFGLARAHDAARETAGTPIHDTHAMTITHTGSAVGTPAYMAPEQLRGEEATAASDQFAFCVALWEGLHGQRPFGASHGSRLEAIERGELGDPPAEARTPAAVRRALQRGLAAKPDDRWDSMQELLAALESALPRRRRAVIAAAVLAIVATAAIAVSIVVVSRDVEGPSCEPVASAAWDDAARQRVSTAFAATGRSYAADTFHRLSRVIEDRTQAWNRMRVEACEATHVRGEQSATLLDLRMACLDRRDAELRALTALLGKGPDLEILDGAIGAVDRLEPIARCDRVALAEVYPPPPPPLAPAVTAARQQLADANALYTVGNYEATLAATELLVATAHRLDYAPLTAEILALHGGALLHAAKPAAKDALYDAALAGALARDDRATVSALISMVPALGDDRGKLADALDAARVAEIALTRAGGLPELKEELALARAQVFRDQARYAEARRLLEETLAARRGRGLGDDTETARTLFQLATVLGDLGHSEQAPPVFLEALAIYERRLGPQHPNVGAVLNNLGMTLERIGRFDDARRHLERALELKERTLGPEHPMVAVTLNNLGMVAHDQGRIVDSAAFQERALAIREKALGAEHPLLAQTLSNLAMLRAQQGRYDDARTLHERSLAMREKLLGPDHPSVAQTLSGLANVHRLQGRLEPARMAITRAIAIREAANGVNHEDLAPPLAAQGYILLELGRPEACASFDRAIRVVEQAHGGDHPDLAVYLAGAAECALAKHRTRDALAFAERAITVGERGGKDPGFAARARFVLARALWRAGNPDDHERALAAARSARAVFADRPAEATAVREIDAWLRARAK